MESEEKCWPFIRVAGYAGFSGWRIMTTGRDCQLNCGDVIEDCVAKPDMICADGHKFFVAIGADAK